MKRPLTAIAAGVFFISPSVCAGDYVIGLKDGGRILVDTYWVEGNTIRVKKYGGMMGISKTLVSRIEKVKTEPTPEIKKAPEEEAPEGTKGEEKSEKEKPAEIAEEEKPDNEQFFKDQKAALSLQVRQALESFKRAKNSGDRPQIDAEFRRVSKISSELEDLEKEVKAKNDGILPPWWREAGEKGK